MGHILIVDPYKRLITSIRISITQKCNLHCSYCHQEGENNNNFPSTEMTPKEIYRIIEVAASFGVEKVKLTGGEPLMRKDILEIVGKVSSLNGIAEVSMTTNGTLLSDLAESLKKAGLARINVSLDTMNPRIFKMITGTDAFTKVVSGIKKAVEANLNPVKVNMVLLKGINEHEVWKMIEFTRKNNAIFQLIELESSIEDEFYRKYHSDITRIEDELKEKSEKVIIRNMHHRRKYSLPDKAEVEVVRPMHNTEFCRNCNRTRITSDGKFKPCLLRSDNLVDFLTPIRNGASIEELRRLFIQSVKKRKPYFT